MAVSHSAVPGPDQGNQAHQNPAGRRRPAHPAGPRSRWHSRERAPYRNRLAQRQCQHPAQGHLLPGESPQQHICRDTHQYGHPAEAQHLQGRPPSGRRPGRSRSTPKCRSAGSSRQSAGRGRHRAGEKTGTGPGAKEPVEPATKSADSRHRAQISRDKAKQSPTPNSSARGPMRCKTSRSSRPKATRRGRPASRIRAMARCFSASVGMENF